MPRAPRTLLPRVLAAVEALSPAPWYTRAWLTWPRAWQAASAMALVALAAGVVVWWPSVLSTVEALRPGARLPVPPAIGALTQAMDAGWDAGRVVWRVLVQPVIGYLIVFAFVMSSACAAFGAALDRVAMGGVSDV